MFDIELYDYQLPENLIAQRPLDRRDESRLLALNRDSGEIRHLRFQDIFNHLGAGDILVLNDTRVIPARLFGLKKSGGKVETLLLEPANGENGRSPTSGVWRCLFKASGKVQEGMTIRYAERLSAEVIRVSSEGVVEVTFDCNGNLYEILDEIGHVPLPPYIRRDDAPEDKDRYQTVYASERGSVAAPTAGLHFTAEALKRLWDNGVRVTNVTLHVGLGTFRPIKQADIRNHVMHREMVEVSESAAQAINNGKDEGKRIVAVGTTTVRTLEFMTRNGKLRSGREQCDCFIYPGYQFQMVDAMLTNFHQPRSSLVLLCSAFAGRERLLAAYREAVEREYRFLSYGDAMLII